MWDQAAGSKENMAEVMFFQPESLSGEISVV